MPRQGDPPTLLSDEQWKEVRSIVEEVQTAGAPPTQQKQRPDESQKRESPSSASGPARSSTDSSVEGPGHQLAEGVRLSQVFSTIRGIHGERTRSGKTSFEEKYAGCSAAKVVEKITAVPTNPHRILETGNTTAFDPFLPLLMREQTSRIGQGKVSGWKMSSVTTKLHHKTELQLTTLFSPAPFM